MADRLIAELTRMLGPGAVLADPDELLVYECDGLPQHKFRPRAVVFPTSTEEVAAVVRRLAADGVPFTARGAGTGLSGGALALGESVIIEFARMRQILRIDPETRTAVVQTGLINLNLSKAAAAHGLYYAPDPSSQPTCTIGGNLAENAGGSHCLKYGVTVDHVIGARVVLADGEIVDLGTGTTTPGYDLIGLFVGSEGTFGIATEATLRLLPVPPAVRTLLADFLDVNDASRAVSAIIAAGLVPAALEMMDGAMIRAVEASVYAAGLPTDAGAALIIELDGLEAGLDSEMRKAREICLAHGAREVRRAGDEKERQKIWKARKGAFGAVGRISPDVMIQDAVVPRSKLPAVLAETYRIADRYRLPLANVFHAGDGNLHPLISFNSRDPDEVARIKEAGREIMETCVRAGGTITGEHGVGLDKMNYLPLIFSDDEMAAMLGVRAAFDPRGLCNPGKIIPVRRGCGEKRAIALPEKETLVDTPAPSFTEMIPPVILKSAPSGFDPEKARAAVAAIVGDENVETEPFPAPLAAFPASVEEAAELVRLAQKQNWAVVPAGAGGWLDAGNPVKTPFLAISTRRLDRLIDHEPADLVVTAEAGMTLGALNDGLKSQWLPVDPPGGRTATLGGIVATGLSGPQGFGYGAPRHHVIGMRVVLADGRIVRAGGRVVKNVAGYDLCKLFTGSYGTLGLIAELTFKLRPRPETETTVAVRAAGLAPLLDAARAVLNSELLPAAVELFSPGHSLPDELETDAGEHVLLIRFAGAAETVAYQVERSLAIAGALKTLLIDDDRLIWSRPEPADEPLVWRVELPRTRVGEYLEFIAAGTNRPRWRAGLGDGRLRFDEAVSDIDDPIAALGKRRDRAVEAGGCLVLEHAPAAIREKFDAWGDAGGGAEIMRRIKARLDAENRFGPGRFAAGI
ncbi:MAG: FAD-binding protein [Acidobacteria bacterium]|nr:FAD-binding protein [Acidobacteriota bacterium]